VGYAIGARDMAVLLEEATGRQLEAISTLDQVLAHRVPSWRPHAEWGT
jgi:hypothetical protein